MKRIAATIYKYPLFFCWPLPVDFSIEKENNKKGINKTKSIRALLQIAERTPAS